MNFDWYVFIEVFMAPMVKVDKINIQRNIRYIFVRLLYDFINWPWQYILHLRFLVFNRWSSWSCPQECRTRHWGLTYSALTSTGSWSPSCTGCWSVPDRNLLKEMIMLLKEAIWLKYATNKMDDLGASGSKLGRAGHKGKPGNGIVGDYFKNLKTHHQWFLVGYYFKTHRS